MSPIPDEKKQAIVSILDQLRPYQPTLGSYVKSLYTTDFDYSVKLSNGRIRLHEELVDDYEANPSSVTAHRYKQAASKFVSDAVTQVAPTPFPVAEPEPAPRSYWRKTLVIIVILIAVCLAYNAIKDSQTATVRVNIYNQVVTERGNYMVNRLFGGISDLKITVTNNSDYLVDIVKIKVTYIKADGDIYKKEMLYFNRMEPHSAQTLDAPNSDRGTSVNVTRESLVCSALAIN